MVEIIGYVNIYNKKPPATSADGKWYCFSSAAMDDSVIFSFRNGTLITGRTADFSKELCARSTRKR